MKIDVIRFRCTEYQRDAFTAAAERAEMTLSEWIIDCCRNVALSTKDKVNPPPHPIMATKPTIEEMQAATVVRAGVRVKREYGALLKPRKDKK